MRLIITCHVFLTETRSGNYDQISSLGRYDKKTRKNRVRSSSGAQSARSSDDSDGSAVAVAHHRQHYPANVKKILLIRKYRDKNIYNDIGIRVTGGKKLPNGELGAFISAINRGKARETLGEIKEGDRVLEWNGVLLSGKTFEEVERVIAASRGEIEVVVASSPAVNIPTASYGGGKSKEIEGNGKNKQERKYDEKYDYSRKSEAPPVPAHRCVDGRPSPSFNCYPTTKSTKTSKAVTLQPNAHVTNTQQLDALGYLKIALAYNRSTSILLVTVISARSLVCRQYGSTTFYPNPFVKVYLLPGRKVSCKRRTKFIPNTSDPIWNQTLEYTVPFCELYSHYLEFTVWDYDKFNDNSSLGQVIINFSDPYVLDGAARWYPLQAIHNNFALPGLLTPQFQVTTSSGNGYSMPPYNPVSLDIGYPAIC